MNITELARKLKIPTTDLKEKLPELGFDIGMRAIKVPDKMANEIIEKYIRRQELVDGIIPVSYKTVENKGEKEC